MTHFYHLPPSGWNGWTGLFSSCPLGSVGGASNCAWEGWGPWWRSQSWCWCSAWVGLGACPRPPHYQTSLFMLQLCLTCQNIHREGRKICWNVTLLTLSWKLFLPIPLSFSLVSVSLPAGIWSHASPNRMCLKMHFCALAKDWEFWQLIIENNPHIFPADLSNTVQHSTPFSVCLPEETLAQTQALLGPSITNQSSAECGGTGTCFTLKDDFLLQLGAYK